MNLILLLSYFFNVLLVTRYNYNFFFTNHSLSLCTCLTFFWYNHTSARILSLKIHTFYHGIFSNLTLSSNSFTNIYAGWPGSVHDARVLRNFHVYSLAEKGELFPPVSNSDLPCIQSVFNYFDFFFVCF